MDSVNIPIMTKSFKLTKGFETNQKKNQNKDWSIIFDFLRRHEHTYIADKNYLKNNRYLFELYKYIENRLEKCNH